MSRLHWEKRKEKIFAELYRFTFGQCGECVHSGCACKDSICAHVEATAVTKGVRLERTGHALRFIGAKGCIVPPHLRETCTIFLCERAQTKPGFDRARYARLKELGARIEWRLMELNEEAKTDAGARRS